jgi:hypothetical protein
MLATQPDFTAESSVSFDRATPERRVGRVAASGKLYRFDPNPDLTAEERERFDEEFGTERSFIFRFGSGGDVSCVVVDARARHYYDVRLGGDDDAEVDGLDVSAQTWAAMVLQPYGLLTRLAPLDRSKPRMYEDAGRETVDGHPCVMIRVQEGPGRGETVWYAATDLKNLVVRVVWQSPGSGNIIELFPPEGSATLRDIRLSADASLFRPPKGYEKVDLVALAAKRRIEAEAELRDPALGPTLDGIEMKPVPAMAGEAVTLTARVFVVSSQIKLTYKWDAPAGGAIRGSGPEATFDTTGLADGDYPVTVEVRDSYGHAPVSGRTFVRVKSVAARLAGPTPFPRAEGGQAMCAISDGARGWYVGGQFSAVDGRPTGSLVHLLADGTIDAAFDPKVVGNVYTLALSPKALFVGGTIHSVGGRTRPDLAAVDPESGRLLDWDPNTPEFIDARALTFAGGILYVGGEFESLGGAKRKNLAALDPSTGRATTWDPRVDGRVSTITADRDRVYIGGDFARVGGVRMPYLAAVDARSGRLLTWDPMATDPPDAIALGDGVVYVSGPFISYGGKDRSKLAALDAKTGEATVWDPGANGRVYDLAILDGTVYVAGDFTAAGGRTRLNVAAIDVKTGRATDWDPEADSWIWTVVPSGAAVFAGGNFESIGRQRRSKIAILDAKTGEARGAR